jgi:glycosyltransferase involved in cell wall biosynthesis
MRVLVILHWLVASGIETMRLKTLPFLKSKGYQIDFYCTGPAANLDEDFLKLGCSIYRAKKTPNPLLTAVRLKAFLKDHPYDLVHSEYGQGSGGFALGAFMAGVPCIISFHNAGGLGFKERVGWKNNVKDFLYQGWLAVSRKMTLKYSSFFVGHSKINLDLFYSQWKNKREKFRLIYNGIELLPKINKSKCRKALGISAKAKVVLHVGTFRVEKNHRGVVDIFEKISKLDDKWKLVLVGDKFERPNIEKYVNAKGLQKKVLFAGMTKKVSEYYCASDVLLFPSFSEGFGNVIVEAQSFGLPVVCSDIPAHREALCPEQYQFMFTLPDYDDAVVKVNEQMKFAANKSNFWIKDSEIYVRKRFDINRMAKDYANLYSSFKFR